MIFPEWLLYLAFGLFGLAFGSFGNVVIWRLPRKESLSIPGSHCPQCDTPIAPYDNIPVISYLFLLGKCRSCKASISIRYPLIELASALLCVFAVAGFSSLAQAVFAAVLCYILLLLSAIDIDTRTLPNSLVGALGLVGIAGLIGSFLGGYAILPIEHVLPLAPIVFSPLTDTALGILGGFVPTLVIALVYERLRGVSGFGFGDIKLLFVLAPFLGIYTALVLPIGCFAACIWLLFLRLRQPITKQTKFAFGPFLAIGAVFVLYWGAPLWNWYLKTM